MKVDRDERLDVRYKRKREVKDDYDLGPKPLEELEFPFSKIEKTAGLSAKVCKGK